ncbi:diphthine--ammonia ligase [Impatiens glandulifera]|uniref:diphthine--ammonia ligase n=1 Tax=Impatiens glandulifera TaxID=253017 RepID=UPI001FB0E329|nr:diphthine--ammonia ligase [Impatiens glandulifera]
MKVVGLVSGGKDSCYVMMKCIEYGHEIVALANLLPADDLVDELDSYMYQTVGHQMVVSYAKCMGVPLFRRRIQGSTKKHSLNYSATPGDEVEDLFILLKEVKQQIPSITAVTSGAIASDYQRLRVESVCSRLGLISLAYLWRQDQSLLLRQMIDSRIQAIIVKVAAIGLDPKKHLGKDIAEMESYLHKLKGLYGINVCGEGGEYETLTLDCPLFKNARLVLDEFEIKLHSLDSIAPVGVLHPLVFRLESKMENQSLNGPDDDVKEVLGDDKKLFEVECQIANVPSDLVQIVENKLQISKTRKANTFSISCWLQESCGTSADLQEDLTSVLMKIESQLLKQGFSWENVVYIHLYLADMEKFAVANEIYVRFITQDKCRFGVPSRSTIELPLCNVGLGNAYIEVLVANDQSKRVLHVQSLSCWAPSCIGPYSQATLHKEILHMAGQLGLDPPTMSMKSGGPAVELEQALKNSEAVANYFNCSISTTTFLFVVYCSTTTTQLDRIAVQERHEFILKQMRSSSINQNVREVLEPVFLYILVPDLPKSAAVEVKPMIYANNDDDMEETTDPAPQDVSCLFNHESWHQFCYQKCVVDGKLCTTVVSITKELATMISPDSTKEMDKIAKFCIAIMDRILLENHFGWTDVMTLRIYYPTRLELSHASLSSTFSRAFDEFVAVTDRIIGGGDPLISFIPVIGAGKSAISMDDVLTCELLAKRS